MWAEPQPFSGTNSLTALCVFALLSTPTLHHRAVWPPWVMVGCLQHLELQLTDVVHVCLGHVCKVLDLVLGACQCVAQCGAVQNEQQKQNETPAVW